MRLFDAGAGDGPTIASTRILTVPNLLSVARLAILPFLYLVIVDGRFLVGLVVGMVFASTDWFDGFIARRFDQVTRLGQLLDPTSDRLFIVTVVAALVVADVVPLWLVVVLVARDGLLLVGGAVVLAMGGSTPPVTRLGKAATFALMLMFPLLLWAGHLAANGSDLADPVRLVGLVGAVVAAAVYWYVGVGYARTMLAARHTTASGSD